MRMLQSCVALWAVDLNNAWCHEASASSLDLYLDKQCSLSQANPLQELELGTRVQKLLCILQGNKKASDRTCILKSIKCDVGGSCYTERALNQFKQLGLDQQCAINFETCSQLHAHSVMYANKLVTTRRATGNKNTSHSQVLKPGASSNPADPH
eukprot:1138875-Pelagomonas_calceolata.AAC.6